MFILHTSPAIHTMKSQYTVNMDGRREESDNDCGQWQGQCGQGSLAAIGGPVHDGMDSVQIRWSRCMNCGWLLRVPGHVANHNGGPLFFGTAHTHHFQVQQRLGSGGCR